MHIPDGFIDLKTAATSAALVGAGLTYALRQVRKEMPPRRIPMLGLGSAFVFTAQMVNFPVIGGTSGHLVGGALIAALLGVPAALVVLTTVLLTQCLIFADGGVTALGANIFNMGIVAPAVGIAVFRLLSGMMPSLRGRVAALAFAGWCSTVAAAIACAGQLAWSKTVAWPVAFPAMTGIHMLIGIGEGAISALVYYAVARTRPDLVKDGAGPVGRGFLVYGSLAALGIALFAAPFACPWPDGLDSVAARLGFEHAAHQTITAPLAEYHIPGIAIDGLSTAVAGVAGAAIAFCLALLLSRLVVQVSKHDSNSEKPTSTK